MRTTVTARLALFAMAAVGIIMVANIFAAAQTETPLYTYPTGSRNNSGIVWPGLIIQGLDGQVWATDQSSGPVSAGSVFTMSTAGQYTSVYTFCAEGGHCLDTGAYPAGGVTLGTDGNYYGTAQTGGAYNLGSVFKLTPSGTLTTLWSFTEGLTSKHIKDEGSPYFAPLLGQDGNFYGVDAGVYNGDYGVFYKITSKGKITPHPFNNSNGAFPIIPVQGTDGNFYGTTQYGGDPSCRCGVVYKATAAGKITVLHVFKGGTNDGYRPLVLAQGNDGAFYGTTYQGGAKNVGIVFKITASGTFTLLYSFLGNPDGAQPQAGLTLGTDGNFYGVTGVGGKANAGTIFQITPAGTEKVLYNFCSKAGCTDGLYSTTPIIQHTNGKFYGNTAGNSNGGSVFYSLDMGLGPFVKFVLWSGKVGSTVEILGQGFSGTSSVSFNGTAAKFKVVSDTYLTATVPVGATSGAVSVATSGGTLVSNQTFLVVPNITDFSPPSGPVGTQVTLGGTGFTGATAVKFGTKAAQFTVNSDSQITATVPTAAKTGKISVTTPGGTATSTSSFTVTP